MKRILIAASIVAAATVVVAVPAATPVSAAPNLNVTVSAPATALVDTPATPIEISVAAANPSGTNGFNVGYRAVLPAGVSYGGTSSAGSPATYPQVGGTTVLWWENVSDILANSSGGLTFSVLAANASFPVNGVVTIPVTALINSDPRTIPTVNASGTVVAASHTGTGSASASTTITAIDIDKSEPSPEGELLRGIHDHETVYTLTVRGNGVSADNAVVVDDYLPAGLEFLGCGAWDNSTEAPTNPASSLEYPGAPTIDAAVGPDLVAGAPDHCLQPSLVETLNVDPDGAGPLAAAVRTHIRWSLGTLAVDEVRTIRYYAGVPMRENTLTWTGTTPATACASGNCAQAANLDNNSGAETTDELDLPNHAIASGTYTGAVAPTTSTTVTDNVTVHVTAEDLRILKGVDSGTIVRDGISRWTLDIATGEYRRVDGPVTVVDTLPDGLCPLGAVNHTSQNQVSDGRCDPVVGQDPSLPYTGAPVENADGSWTITWVLAAPTFTRSDTFQISFSTRARVHYQQNFLDAAPVLANDSWTNTVDILPVAAQLDVTAPGLPAANQADDTSSAGQSAPNPGIQKDVANPPTSGVLDCDTATWRDADDDATAATYYRPGDRVCYRIQLLLNDIGIGTELQYRDVDVTDYLPPGFVFEQYWGTNPTTGETTGDTINTVDALAVENTSAGQMLTWELGSTTPEGRFVDANAEPFFEVVFSATIPLNGGTGGAFVLRANLAKATSSNTAGAATSLREAAVELTTRPAMSILKSRVPSAATVATGSSITYTVTVRNDAPAETGGTTFGAARNISVRDVLPYEITCADVSPINDGGVCTDGVTTGTTPSPVRSVIDWTIAGPVNPQGTSAVTYVVNLDDDLAPSEDLTNTAGVRSYDQPVNTGGPDVTYVPPTATTVDPTAVPNDTVPAIDSETVALTNVTMAKLQQSSITETGNPSNASLVNTAETVTVGEEISYRVTATIPANATVYGSPTFTDTLPTGFRILNSPSPTATLNGNPLPGGWGFTVNTASSPNTLAVTLPANYVTDATSDVIAMEFQVVVEDVVANADGQTRTNNTAFNFITKADDMNVVVQARTRTASANALVREPRPTITKNENDADDAVVPGQTVTYTLTVGNNRTTPGHDLVVTDCVPSNLVVQTPVAPPGSPAGVTVATASGDPACASGTLITWTFPTAYALDAGATTVLTYDVVVANSLVAASSLRNDAAVTFDSTGGTNPDERDYSATTFDTVTITNPALTKSHTPDPVTIGETAAYTLQVTLPANVLIYDSVVVDDLPPGLSFEGMTGVSCAPAACPAVTVLGATAPQDGPTVGYWLGDIGPYASQQTITITYAATVLDQPANTSGDTFVNTADTRWNRTDLVAGTPAAIPVTHDVTLTPVSDTLHLVEPTLRIDKDVALTGCNTTAAPIAAGLDDDACDLAPNGAAFTYTLTVENTGTSAAHQVRIVDDADLPASAFASLTVTANGGTTVVDSSIVDGDGLEFTYAGPLAAGGRLTITYDVVLRGSASLSQLQQIVNTAGVPSYEGMSTAAQTATLGTYPGRDFRTYTEHPTDADTVTLHYPQPTIVKTAVSDASDARIGSPFTWQLLVGNADTTAALVDYDLVDTLPAGWTYVAGSAQVSSVTAGATPAVGAIADPAVVGQTLTWTDLGDVPAGATVTVRFQATPTAVLETLADTGSFQHVNTASVAGDDATGAPANADGPYDDTDTANALIRRADLTIDKSITPATGPYGLGQDVQYTIVVRNDGPDGSTGSVVGDVLPPGLTYRSTASISQGTLDGGTLDWTVGALANGASATLVINAELNATGSLTNVAEIESDQQWDPDSVPGNGSTTEDDDDSVTISVVATSLGDRVWLDLDGDGVQDPGEPGIPNVTLELRDAGPNGTFGDGDDGPTLTTLTAADGTYGFSGLRVDRTYRVTVGAATLPSGVTPSFDLDGIGTADSATTTVPTTTANLAVDFGYRGVGSIGDTVWIDLDASAGATRQPGEPGIGAVDITVTWAGFDLVLGTADDVALPAVTDAAGAYLVTNLPYGDYTVAIDPASLPAGLDPTFDLDGTGTAHTTGATLSGVNPDELDADFSYTGGATLGDRVWLDLDGDGTQEAGEPGIPGIDVELVWFGPDDAPGGGDDVVSTTTTGADGLYLFVNLPAGSYRVTVTPPAGVDPSADLDGIATPHVALTTLTAHQARTDVDFGYVGIGSIGDQVWWDVVADGDGVLDGIDRPLAGVDLAVTWAGVDGIAGNADDISFAATTDASGEYLVAGLPVGAYTVEVDPASLPAGLDVATHDLDGVGTAHSAGASLTLLAPDRTDVDFSYTGAGSIGDAVWYDVDGDGTAAPELGDPTLDGVDLVVTWLGTDGQPGGGDDVVFTATTAGGGLYLVDHLPFGSYTVALDQASLPAGLDVATYDLDGVGTLFTTDATLTALVPDELDADFAVTGSGSIGDTVYLDLDGDGTQDAGEPGLPGVSVTLTFVHGGTPVTLTLVTDADGRYVFPRLPAGSFTVTVDSGTLPAGVTPTADLDGIGTAHTTGVVLTAGQNRVDADFGYRGTASIGDQVWWEYDLDGDGTFDAGDVPMEGVSVEVEWAGTDGVFGTGDEVTIDVVTDSDGLYLVDGLPFGDFVVRVDTATLEPGVDAVFDLDGVATPNVAERTLDVADPDARDVDFSYAGTGSIGDTVWHDRDADGVVDLGEEPLAGVDVTVVWAGPDGVAGTADDVTFTDTTDASGRYLVEALPPGRYTVSIDPATVPVGFAATFDLDGGRDRVATAMLAAGEDRTDVDFGEREEADLTVSKTHDGGPFAPGDDVTYTVTVRNLGPGVARAVSMVDTLPTGLTAASASGTGWSCTVAATITCTLGSDLAAGATAPLVTVVATVDTAIAATTVNNTVRVTTSTPDPDPDNDEDTDPTSIYRLDLSIAKDLVGDLVSGRSASYRLTVANNGPVAAVSGDIRVVDTLPTQLTPTAASGAGFTCAIAGSTVTCTSTSPMAVGESRVIDLTVRVASGNVGAPITNTADVASLVTGDVVPANNVDQATGIVADGNRLPTAGADVGATVAVAVGLLLAGAGLLLGAQRRRRTVNG